MNKLIIITAAVLLLIGIIGITVFNTGSISGKSVSGCNGECSKQASCGNAGCNAEKTGSCGCQKSALTTQCPCGCNGSCNGNCGIAGCNCQKA